MFCMFVHQHLPSLKNETDQIVPTKWDTNLIELPLFVNFDSGLRLYSTTF